MKKLTLQNLKIQSFTTTEISDNRLQTIKGGTGGTQMVESGATQGGISGGTQADISGGTQVFAAGILIVG